jgi:hypothetical protein
VSAFVLDGEGALHAQIRRAVAGALRDRAASGKPFSIVVVAEGALSVEEAAMDKRDRKKARARMPWPSIGYRVGAEIAGDPQALASALQKIDSHARRIVNTTAERNPASGQLFIINPLAGRGADNLFSTHPATGNRVKALMELGLKMGVAPRPAFGTEAPKGPGSTSVPTTPVPAPPRASGPWG